VRSSPLTSNPGIQQDLRKIPFEPPLVGAHRHAPFLYVASLRKSCSIRIFIFSRDNSENLEIIFVRLAQTPHLLLRTLHSSVNESYLLITPSRNALTSQVS